MNTVLRQETVRKALAVILGGTATAVLIHFVCGVFYRDAIEAESIWTVLNWFMAFSVVVALVVTYAVKSAADQGDDAKAFVSANAKFYAAAALAILFCWNWFNEMVVGGGNEGDVNLIFWTVIDTVFPVLIGNLSVNLWKRASRA